MDLVPQACKHFRHRLADLGAYVFDQTASVQCNGTTPRSFRLHHLRHTPPQRQFCEKRQSAEAAEAGQRKRQPVDRLTSWQECFLHSATETHGSIKTLWLAKQLAEHQPLQPGLPARLQDLAAQFDDHPRDVDTCRAVAYTPAARRANTHAVLGFAEPGVERRQDCTDPSHVDVSENVAAHGSVDRTCGQTGAALDAIQGFAKVRVVQQSETAVIHKDHMDLAGPVASKRNRFLYV